MYNIVHLIQYWDLMFTLWNLVKEIQVGKYFVLIIELINNFKQSWTKKQWPITSECSTFFGEWNVLSIHLVKRGNFKWNHNVFVNRIITLSYYVTPSRTRCSISSRTSTVTWWLKQLKVLGLNLMKHSKKRRIWIQLLICMSSFKWRFLMEHF